MTFKAGELGSSPLCPGFRLLQEFSLLSHSPSSLTPWRVPNSGSLCCGAACEIVNTESTRYWFCWDELQGSMFSQRQLLTHITPESSSLTLRNEDFLHPQWLSQVPTSCPSCPSHQVQVYMSQFPKLLTHARHCVIDPFNPHRNPDEETEAPRAHVICLKSDSDE